MSEFSVMETEKQLLERSLKKLLKQKQSVVISLKGSWGIGKTCFWNKFAAENLKGTAIKKKYAYVSLFGLDSIDEIKNKIALQIYPHKRLLKLIRNIFDGVSLHGFNLGSFINIVNINDFKNVIICFDDFERISNNVSIKDVMGLISELKEQLHCKIIIINNIDQLEYVDDTKQQTVFKVEENNNDQKKIKQPHQHKLLYVIKNSNNKEIYDTYEEKIIDYNLIYKPSITETFNLLKDDLKYKDNDIILELLHTSNDCCYSNIRLIKKLITHLNCLEFINTIDINNMLNVSITYYFFCKVFSINDNPNEFNIHRSKTIVSIDTIIPFLDDIIQYSFIINREDFLKELLNVNKTINENSEISKINLISEKFEYDLNYTNEEFSKDLFQILTKYKNKLIEYLGFNNFDFYIKQLKDLNPLKSNDFDSLYIEAGIAYIDKRIQNNIYDIHGNSLLDSLLRNNVLKNYYNEQCHLITKNFVEDTDSIVRLFSKIREAGAWSNRDIINLSLINYDKHIQHMTKSREYFEESFNFFRWTHSMTNTYFQATQNNLKKAFEELHKIPAYRFKIDRLMKIIGIDFNYEEKSQINNE